MYSQNTPFHVHRHDDDDEHARDMHFRTEATDASIEDMKDMMSSEANHKAHLKDLLYAFAFLDRSFTAADICGKDWWDNFTDDEKRSAEYWIGIYITDMDFPLSLEDGSSYPEPRRYRFTR